MNDNFRAEIESAFAERTVKRVWILNIILAVAVVILSLRKD